MLPKRKRRAQRSMLHDACLSTAQALGERSTGQGSRIVGKQKHSLQRMPSLTPLICSQMQGTTKFMYQSIHKGVGPDLVACMMDALDWLPTPASKPDAWWLVPIAWQGVAVSLAPEDLSTRQTLARPAGQPASASSASMELYVLSVLSCFGAQGAAKAQRFGRSLDAR